MNLSVRFAVPMSIAVSSFALIASAVTGSAAPPAALQVIHGATVFGEPVLGVPIDVDLRSLPVEPPWQPGDPIREVPRRDSGDGRPVIDTPDRLDPLLARQEAVHGPAPAIVEIHNFEGNHSTANPNDPTGDIGANFFVEAINGPGGTSVTMYAKADASLVAGPFALDTLAPAGVPCASGAGDPIVIYDHLAGRWLLSEFSGGGNRLCVYVSRTADPLAGGWCFYEFADTTFPDYPKYGVWPEMYLVTTNQFNTPPVYAFDRVNMQSPDGVDCPTARAPQKITAAPGLPGLGFETFTPVDLDGPPPPAGEPAYFVRHRDEELNGDPGADPATDKIELWSLVVDFDTPANTTFSQAPDLIVADFDSNLCPPISVFSCIPQPNGGQLLDPLLEVIMNRASYRNFGSHATILGVLQTDIGDFTDHSGERWMEFRKDAAPGSTWSLFQEGTVSPDAEGRFMGTAAMDAEGNILLAYNVSSTAVFPSIRYTGRQASDPLGVMTVPETELATGNGINSTNRYGDYNQMGVDPVDSCTFWFLGMYNPNPSGDTKGVRIGAAQFNSCPFLVVDSFEDPSP